MTKQPKQANLAVTLAAYVMGASDKAPIPARITAVSVLQAACLSNLAADAAEHAATRARGGAQGVALAAALTLQHIEPSLASVSPAKVTGWMLDKGLKLSPNEASANVMRANLHRIMAACQWRPTTSGDNAACFSEALAFVREKLAEHGTLTAWREACPKQSTKGRKPQPVGKQQKASKGKAAPAETAPEALTPTVPVLAMTASKALEMLANMAKAGDADALNAIRKLAIDATEAYDAAEAEHAKADGRKKRRAA